MKSSNIFAELATPKSGPKEGTSLIFGLALLSTFKMKTIFGDELSYSKTMSTKPPIN